MRISMWGMRIFLYLKIKVVSTISSLISFVKENNRIPL